MTIIDYIDCSRDTEVLGSNVYASSGQGCGTVWYDNVEQARRVINTWGEIPDGRNSGLCKDCQCSYSYGSRQWKKAKGEFLCQEWKIKVAQGEIKPAGDQANRS